VLCRLTSEEHHETNAVRLLVQLLGRSRFRHRGNCKTPPVRFTATEIARAVGGELLGADPDADPDHAAGPDAAPTIDGVTIDSRAVVAGQLFVPIVAERDGHAFIRDAVARGATAYLTSNVLTGLGALDVIASAIVVEDTGRALLDLGRHARLRLDRDPVRAVGNVIGITGSVGKTTVKDLTGAALGTVLSVHVSPRSFNNELGVPITLANSPDGVDAVVIEMGARGREHIADLCAIARPTIGVVTTVALAHTELFGTIEDVADAKGELIEALPPSGMAVLNGDNPLVAAMATRTYAHALFFGMVGTGLDVTASNVVLDAELRPSFELQSPWGDVDAQLQVRGEHQVMNALAAAATAMACGVLPEDVADGLARATLSPWRMDLQRATSGALVLNDSYNANPTSMEAALHALAALPARRRFAVVGVMAELGPSGPAEHRRIAGLAHDLGIELIPVNAPEYGVADDTDTADAVARVEVLGQLGDGDAVLVKGSRVAGLEALAAMLLG
jgi:UDP-N-acetylmuramoyl-tripeptide--D-alanyl-D-alanine ligase